MTQVRYLGLVLVVALWGCKGGVPEEQHLQTVNDLDECKEQSLRWESLYQESVEERRVALDQALEILPTANEELRQQINVRLDQVTQELDEALKAEVQESVFELAQAIAEGYNVLQQENERLQMQLAESRSLIETVLEKTGTIEEKVGTEKDTFLANRQGLLLEIGEVEAFVRDWQYMYVDCKDCDERLRINKKERDALAQLGEEILQRLTAVRERITASS